MIPSTFLQVAKAEVDTGLVDLVRVSMGPYDGSKKGKALSPPSPIKGTLPQNTLILKSVHLGHMNS